jgi:hypothetical protein
MGKLLLFICGSGVDLLGNELEKFEFLRDEN